MPTSSKDVASSVAQILRDRALVEQVEVNPILRAELDSSLKVEITGARGGPVYFQGDIRDGEEVGPTWMVWFDKWPSGTMSLSTFIESEVRVGGICSSYNLNLMGTKGFSIANRRFTCYFGSPGRFCLCSFQLTGLSNLGRLEDALEQNREADDETSVLRVREILSELADIHPTARVNVLSVAFVEQFDKCVIERARRCQKYSKGANRHHSITTISPEIAANLAEALTDNTLMAQTQTNQDVLVELEASLKVEVTSTTGDAIYAQATFQDGWQAVSGWMVLMACTPHHEGMGLSDLNNLAVRVGGIVLYTCPSDNLLRRRVNKFNEEKQFILYIGQIEDQIGMFCAVLLQFRGLPEHFLEHLEAAMNHNKETNYGAESHDIIEILNQLGHQHPDARAHVVEISFQESDVKPVIERSKLLTQIRL